MNYRWQRLLSWCNRFGTLRQATRVFQAVPAGSMVSRRLFGGTIALDVSRSLAQQLLLLEGERFVDERFVLRPLLRPGMTVVDVGANIGYYLLLAEQSVGVDGRVVCIEPSIENLPELRRTISDNGFANVVLHEVALGDHEGSVGLHTGINSGVADEAEAAPYSVPLRRLDQLVREPVHFLKIDVEGYEGQVLAGAEALLAANQPTLFLELHPQSVSEFGYSIRGILAGLTRHYSRITLYEKTPHSEQTLLDKIATRYFGRDPLRAIDNVERFVARCDANAISYTCWAVCKA